MTRAEAIQGATLHTSTPARPEYGNWLQFWHEIHEAFDYVNARKALLVAGANWEVKRQSAAEVTVTIYTMRGPG